jgi:hypothetical protein
LGFQDGRFTTFLSAGSDFSLRSGVSPGMEAEEAWRREPQAAGKVCPVLASPKGTILVLDVPRGGIPKRVFSLYAASRARPAFPPYCRRTSLGG